MIKVTVTLVFDLLTLNLIGLKLLRGQGFFVQCQCDLDLLPTDPKIKRDHL